jgi:protein TonB
VVLNAVVGNDGNVRTVTVLNGDPALTKAALEAVAQWQFKPYLVKGQATAFETRITVNFVLP